MKLLIREYLSSLKERGELDAILPDMLSELGFTIISRPSIGTRQHGVDMAAVGVDTDGQEKLFLFSIKAGDLTRSNWDAGPNSLRPSLEEIRDVYIGSHVPQEYATLPKVICVCLGGDIHESARGNISGYIKIRSESGIEYQEWNGDRIAGLLLSGILSEELVPPKARALFRKSVAMLDEPDVSWSYFCELVRFLAAECKTEKTKKRTVSAVRQITLCLWVLFVWSRDVGNLESPFLSSEFAVLHVWGLLAPRLEEESAEAGMLRDGHMSLISLHMNITEAYVEKIGANAGVRHGLSTAVSSMESVDVNLELFEVLGRFSMCGLWTVFFIKRTEGMEENDELRQNWRNVQARLVKNIAEMIQANGVLVTPIKDEQVIDIGLACLFLLCTGQRKFVRGWIESIVGAVIWAYRTEGPYPCIVTEYRELLVHPTRGDEYRKRSTNASILFPSLAVWATLIGATQVIGRLCEFVSNEMGHCNMQLWFPGDDSEKVLYTNVEGSHHGSALVGLEITNDGREPLKQILEECRNNTAFERLSAIRWGIWPIVLMASRHYRLPIPPQFWRDMLKGLKG